LTLLCKFYLSRNGAFLHSSVHAHALRESDPSVANCPGLIRRAREAPRTLQGAARPHAAPFSHGTVDARASMGSPKDKVKDLLGHWYLPVRIFAPSFQDKVKERMKVELRFEWAKLAVS
jgi:hypothetical protein